MKPDIRESLQGLSKAERTTLLDSLPLDDKEKVRNMNDEEVLDFLCEKLTHTDDLPRTQSVKRWFDKNMCGLTKEGLMELKTLEEQNDNPVARNHVDQKRLRYLRQLKNMRLRVPDSFRCEVDVKALFKRLADFAKEHDIPTEVVQHLMPSIVEYIETGRMRPVILVGNPGCGKTTSLRLVLEKALDLPVEVLKVPQMDASHGLTGDAGTYQSADCGAIAKARSRCNSLVIAIICDEIDKCTHNKSRASIDDQLLSICDESVEHIKDEFLETELVALEHCPVFMTGNDLNSINQVLADRCSIIKFPDPTQNRIKAIMRKFVKEKCSNKLFRMIHLDDSLLDRHIEVLVQHNVTSLRKHQQLVEAALNKAVNIALVQEHEDVVAVTEEMLTEAASEILGNIKRRAGFAS